MSVHFELCILKDYMGIVLLSVVVMMRFIWIYAG